ncbi:MAG: hypothetical protein Q7S43_03325 [bacterium]|nr:hypothetical protein [bacterium]
MRKGRGLVDSDIYDELVKIQGAKEILLSSLCNFRTDPRTGKVRAEISEDAWPEVKQMVENLKRRKAGKKQVAYRGKPAPKSPFARS